MASITLRKSKVITYTIKVSLGKDDFGKYINTYTQWKNEQGLSAEEAEKAAKAFAEQFEAEAKAQYAENQEVKKQERKGNITYEKFINSYWLPLFVESGELKATTAEGYKHHIKTSVEYFGKVKLDKINFLLVTQYLKWLRTEYRTQYGKPVAEKTVKHYFNAVKAAFDFAVKTEFLEKSPAADVKTPKVHKTKVESLTKEQAKQFLEALNSADLEFKTQMYILLTSGLRRGELLGLQWQDIDFFEGTAEISRNIVRTTGNTEICETPKTENSFRTVPLSNMALALLAQLRTNSRSEWVFSLRKPDSLTTKLERFMRSNNLPDCSPHKLRHTCATLLCHNGVDINTIQNILGHKDASTTLNYYIAADDTEMRKAVRQLDKALA